VRIIPQANNAITIELEGGATTFNLYHDGLKLYVSTRRKSKVSVAVPAESPGQWQPIGTSSTVRLVEEQL